MDDLSISSTEEDGKAIVKWNHKPTCIDIYQIVVNDDHQNKIIISQKLTPSSNINETISMEVENLQKCQFYSLMIYPEKIPDENSIYTWHQGFTQKFFYINSENVKITFTDISPNTANLYLKILDEECSDDGFKNGSFKIRINNGNWLNTTDFSNLQPCSKNKLEIIPIYNGIEGTGMTEE